MGYNKITNFLGKPTEDDIPKFTTIKWIKIFDQSNGTYNKNKDIRFKTSQLRNDLCDFNDAYIVATGKITATNPGNNNNVYNRKLVLNNSAPSFNCILKINNQLIEDAQDLDILMPMYNLLYYSKNFRKITGSFWNYYPHMLNSGYDDEDNERERIFYPIKDSKGFDHKTKLIDSLGNNLPAVNNLVKAEKYVEIVESLKNLNNFMFNLDFLMINSEIELVLKWTEDCVSTEKATRDANDREDGPPVLNPVAAINRPEDPTFNNVNRLFCWLFQMKKIEDHILSIIHQL